MDSCKLRVQTPSRPTATLTPFLLMEMDKNTMITQTKI